uniref:Uncharacterized protein n=1 Tax=Zea mays TaxID=4577 RepID=B6UE35_MAIZE|nr:hypothetical protein [Zea mays]
MASLKAAKPSGVAAQGQGAGAQAQRDGDEAVSREERRR